MNVRFLLQPPHRALAVFALAVATTLLFLGTRGLWDPDEGRFSNVALQILRSGDWISLYRHHETLHFTKPPVTYWAIAASVSALGWNEWAVRLPGALAHLGIVALLLRIGRHFAPRRPWLPALVYATFPLTMLASGIATTDTPLAFATTLAFACYVIARFESRPAWMLGMWAGFALAFMTKGPPGLIGLAAVLVLHAFGRRDAGLPSLRLGWGLPLFVVLGFSWYLVVVVKHPGLLEYFVHHEVVARVASDVHGRYPEWWGGLYVYGLTLGLGALPWWPWALAAWRRGGGTFRDAAPTTRLLLAWLGVGLLVFMLARSRLPLYVLPLFAPLALLIGRALEAAPLGRARWAAVAAVLALVIGVKVLLAYLPQVAEALPARTAERLPLHKNAREWAERLDAVVPYRIEEVVFVNDMARYGLNLYLHAEIEKTDVDGDLASKPISDAPFDDVLGHELREKQPPGRVFVMRPAMAARFEAEARDAGVMPTRLGAVRDRVVYTLAPQGTP
ncbi:MAG: glycosyltransferase family 39 protein [Silanimonas sp.]|nr:glycosyltransferase family 39 protein [Silanimonas sp.]